MRAALADGDQVPKNIEPDKCDGWEWNALAYVNQELENMEPDKCDGWEWYDWENLQTLSPWKIMCRVATEWQHNGVGSGHKRSQRCCGYDDFRYHSSIDKDRHCPSSQKFNQPHLNFEGSS
ncbi:hypothetical protein POM88_027698 [Heracleum sosnowskyi]|uniref:Uncharacterized protein n=1 Tax=Heracleum sosnowskyi TaxID=360622 RepID=A0AAD8I9H8_9APIA|nr:hypothetical protein POM88_027698 [Heracleum sosnowskyi]